MDNLQIYNQSREVPKEAQKSFSNGSFSGTDINPMWRIKKLTELFGPVGFGWYTEITEKWEETVKGEILTNVQINLYVKIDGEWSKPIVGIGGNKALQQFRDKEKISDEAYKMAYTDAISVAAKALGIGADIYFQNDPTKYSPRPSSETAENVEVNNVEALIAMVNKMDDANKIKELYQQFRATLSKEDAKKLYDAAMANPACQKAVRAKKEVKKEDKKEVKNETEQK